MKHYTLLLVTALFCWSCGSSSKKEGQDALNPANKNFYEVDLSRNFSGSNDGVLLLSDIVDEVEYVQLETTDDCLVGNSFFCALADKDVYILNTSFSAEKLLRFDRSTGRFIAQIGQIGQGPQDMLRPTALYAENDRVYAASNISGKVYVYHKDGTQVRTVDTGRGTGQRITVLQDKYIVRHSGQENEAGSNNSGEGNRNLYYAVKILDMDGNVLHAKCDTLPDGKTSVALDWDPKRWYFNGMLNFYNEMDNTVYAVNEKGVTPRYKFNLGKNRWNTIGKITKEYLDYIKFHQFKETTDYLYIYWNQYQKPYFARYDKRNGKLDVQEQEPYQEGRFWHLVAYGPKNDIDGCGMYFNPADGNYEDKAGSIIFAITPDNIDKVKEALLKAEKVKYPEKRRQLLEMLNGRAEDENPLLVIYKLKK